MKNVLSKSIFRIIQGAVKTFRTFPAAMGSALGLAVVTMIKIQLDWPQQQPYNFLLNCLHWSFALGAIFSLAAITAARSRYEGEKTILCTRECIYNRYYEYFRPQHQNAGCCTQETFRFH